MKKLLLIVNLCAFVFNVFAGEAFSRGFEKGWKEGWRSARGNYAFTPFTPFPPFPEFGHDDFWSGYNVGFLMAIQKAESE